LNAGRQRLGTIRGSAQGMSELKPMSERTLALQCAVIDAYRRVPPRDAAERGLWEELLKTHRALSDNSAESDGTQSRKDFIQKFHICLKRHAKACNSSRH
jgi:hypothetical protein